MSNNSSSSSGIGVLGLLGVAFVVLKLLKIIDWSWWYVTMPFWGGFAILIIVLIFVGIWWLASKKTKKRGITITQKEKPVSRFQQKLKEAMEQSEKLKQI
jgi:membrane-bound ClpP family serine protease